MLLYELDKLVKSLSGSEKKHIQLHSEQLKGDKDYIVLYQLMLDEKNSDTTSWQQQFKELHPSKSLENTAAYLYKIVTDLLVEIRIDQDTWYQQYHHLMKARLCFERSIPSRAFKELRKASKLAAANQHHAVSYQAARMELTALADLGFPGLDEQQLVDKQMKAKRTLQSLRQIQEHYSLYELLSHRFTKGKVNKNAQQSKQVNDLILSELSLSTRGSQYQFEPQRLHLLFQSFFFIHTGEYHSALRIFDELTKLIEANESMWDYPPYDYLSALDGILDSLRSIGYYQEMASFIDKTITLSEHPYPEHFKSLALLTANVYQLNRFVGQGESSKAKQFIESLKHNNFHPGNLKGHEKQLELLYFQGLVHFLLDQWHQAKSYLSQLQLTNNPNTTFPVYRVGRLLHILLCYELDDLDYLDYEIRSHKRAFSKRGKAYKTEKLLFNIIMTDPKRRGNAWKAKKRIEIEKKLREIKSDKRELDVLKFFDFGQWALKKHA